ncbi:MULTISPECIES: ABC transporter permease [Oceanobacillus]|uniref:ABC transporter permease n=1 Tax=Oceanobacillus TaxID=182709 RepID=UPI00186774B8|nr:ABC transporter permease [Oceanobacillus oncorhynchi]UUI39792.1 ABC transporter permease [Oceanobacillus oncorhynchi]
MNGTARTLFLKRLQSDYKNLWEASKLILDWTLFIYILIPGIAIGAFFYMEWLQDIPFLLNFIGWYGWMMILVISFFFHHIKLFTYLADQLFLSRNIPLLRRISQYAIVYSTSMMLLTATLFFIIAAPFLSKLFSLSLLSLGYLWLYYLSGVCLLTLWKKYAQIHISSFIIRSISIILILILWISLSQGILLHLPLWIMWITLSVIAITFVSDKLAYHGTHFLKIAEMDEQTRGKWVNLLFTNVRQQGYKPPSAKPIRLWKESQVMFQKQSSEMIFTDAYFKSFFRNLPVLMPLVQLTGLLIAVLIVSAPHWTGYLFWLASIYIIVDITKTGWLGFRFNSFIELFSWRESMLRGSLETSVRRLSSPILFVIGLLFGYLKFGLFGMLIFSIISVLSGIGLVYWHIRYVPVNHVSIEE